MGEGGYKEGHDSGSVPGGKGDIASVQHKLALLLQVIDKAKTV